MLLSDPDMQDFIRLSIAAPELSNMMIASTYLFDITKIDFGSDKSGLPYVFVDVYTDLRDESIPVTYAPEGTFSAWVLHGIGMGAISFDPFRAAILYDGASSDWLGKTTREECFHRWDLWYTDPSNIIRYFTELKRLRDYYGSWNKAYGYSVYEQRAKVYAGFLSVLDVKLVPANDPWDYNYWPFWHSGIFRV